MNAPCGNSHPLYNPGSTQKARTPEPLDPAATKYDERTVSDWLVFLSKYAQHINFFELGDEETASDTWARFFDHDVSVLLARLAEEQTNYLQRAINGSIKTLAYADVTPNRARKDFTLLVAHLFNIIYRLNGYYQNLEPNLEINEEIKRRIFTQVEPRLARLVSYFKAAQDENLIDASTDQNLPEGYQTLSTLADWELLKVWYPSSLFNNWKDFVEGTPADSSPFERNVLTPSNDAEKINLAVRYQLFAETVKGLLGGFVGIVTAGRKAFEETVQNWPDHQPDRALLISFLRLLELYRNEINSFNTRHLDHYYKEVLRLKPKPPVPDGIFLVAEMANNKTEAKLAKGTQFTGGKDDSGVERIYAADEDTIINQAQVTAQKALLKSGNKVYAAQNVATTDGIDGELEFPEDGWPAFGHEGMAQAKMGFAIASDHLLMEDGVRDVDLVFTINQSINLYKLNQIASRAEIKISGSKDWIAITGGTFVKTDTGASLKLSIPADRDPIVALDQKIHDRSYYPVLPVIEFYASSGDLQYLQSLEISAVQVKVDVKECKHMEVHTLQGQVDTSKPFQPFGPIPTKDSAIVIGMQEMVTKKNTSITINNTWTARTNDEQNSSKWNSATLEVEQLDGNTWSLLKSDNSKSSIAFTNLIYQKGVSKTAFTPKANKGFVRLRLNEDLEHKGYPSMLAEDMAKIAVSEYTTPEQIAGITVPKPYYIPTLEKFSISYTAKTDSLSVANSAGYKTDGTVFYHLSPFGACEASGKALDVDYPSLIPALENEGELFIGLENAKGGSRTSVLIQLAEGSANPLKAKQAVTWQYMHNNRWVDFESGDLTDGTEGLIKSGIVQVSLPFGFEDESTFFNDDRVWIRATVKQHTDAVCRIVGLYAQAVKATLSSAGHSNKHYSTPLEAESVSKLKKSNAAFKKFSQPMAAVGGAAKEDPNNFYTRTSERLRHKQRSVSMWDYERLVLQQFPAISKAKALSHTRYYVDPVSNQVQYSESTPGNLALVCVPQKATTFESEAKPFTPIDTLEDVKTYLEKHLPDWATLHVRNPIFEEVEVDCRVEFLPHIKDKEFYKRVLKEDLKSLLSPWRGQAGNELRFDWRIHKSEIIDFIDERPYIDYVRDLKLNVIYGSGDDDRNDDVKEAIPRYAVSVLISASDHQVELVTS